jgi:energy-coupling factor transporter transmembrane protein EcfT
MTIDILSARDDVEKTFLHTGIQPLTKFVMVISVLVVSGLWLDFRFLLPLFFIGLILDIAGKAPKAWFILMVSALLLTWYPTLRTTIAQANPEYFKVLDPTWASTSVATIEVNFLNLGTMGLTYGTLFWLAGRIMRFATVLTWAIFFVSTTPMNQIANTMYAINIPYQIVFVLQMTYKFIPQMSTIINQISEAQKLRGWSMKTINPKKLVERALPIANPMIRRTAMIVEQVTTATQIRGFGSGKPTPIRDLEMKTVDWVIVVISLLFMVVSVFGVFAFNWGAL